MDVRKRVYLNPITADISKVRAGLRNTKMGMFGRVQESVD